MITRFYRRWHILLMLHNLSWRWCYKRQNRWFFDICSTFKDGGKKVRYEVDGLWARLLRHWRTPYKKHERFDFHNNIKCHLRNETKREVIDDQMLLLTTQIVLLNLLSNTYTKRVIDYNMRYFHLTYIIIKYKDIVLSISFH